MLLSRRLIALAGALALTAVCAGCGLFGGDGPDKTVQGFLTAWAAGDDKGAAALTDDPTAAEAVLGSVRMSLKPVRVSGDIAQVRTASDRSTASVNITWDLGENRMWSYLDELSLTKGQGGESKWLIHFTPMMVHPQLAAGQQLTLRTTVPQPAPVVDRGGVPLLQPTQVITVLLDRLAAGDLPAVTKALAAALSPIDHDITQQSITDGAAKTPDGQGYTVAALRNTDYQTVKPAIHELPGVTFSSSELLLGPDATFAQQVLPEVRTATLAQLSGVAGWSVQVIDGSGAKVRTLTEQAPKPGTTVTIGMDRALQAAAEDVVERIPQQAALVAIAPSTGDLLAVAQNEPADAAGAISLTGRFPPGSTFKIATAAAAVGASGLNALSPVACPGVTVIGGRAVPNEGKFDLGTVPLRTAFARSCNTTFAQLGSQLGPDALPAAALSLGLGADFAVPALTTVTGSVPASPEQVQRAENGFGQGEVLASPLGMALMAATVAHGSPVVPQLIRGQPTKVLKPATAPDPAVLAQVRTMMRAVVTEGTAKALAGSGEVYGKTGTAEFGGDGHAHGWFVGYRGDVAFAILIVDGASSAPAVVAAQQFLAATG
ncbi:penicillin-binding transpeptidase domain-containing protein [Pseudonocardia sp. GCM10023141]|uniref:penicillin-binding transpeptidase domain-containing protein n=1 Tax=Pseudonocardia sp. GCM10023141 TaxID=3252653 RepID=UPI003610743F